MLLYIASCQTRTSTIWPLVASLWPRPLASASGLASAGRAKRKQFTVTAKRVRAEPTHTQQISFLNCAKVVRLCYPWGRIA